MLEPGNQGFHKRDPPNLIIWPELRIGLDHISSANALDQFLKGFPSSRTSQEMKLKVGEIIDWRGQFMR